MNTYLNIARLLARKATGTPLTSQEQETLNAWLQDEKNRESQVEIESLSLARRIVELEQMDYGKKMAARFHRERQQERRRLIIHRCAYWISGVAALVLLVFSMNFFFDGGQKERTSVPVVAKQGIIPGESKAMLTLADGREFGIIENDGKAVSQLIDSVSTAEAIEVSETAATNTPIYNTLSVPRGGEFFHQLADGSKVWLNSDSELRFPETFADGERRIYLKGEAFFEVEKEERPFIVTTRQGDIRVYGTRFCATDYEQQPFSTVLVEGSIGFRPSKGEEICLTPSQRLEYNTETGSVKVETVDTSLYTAWVNHYFLFKGQALEEIMTTLSRWYNFNVVFADDSLRSIRLSGRLYRNDDVQILLNSYAKTAGIKFKIKDNNIIITQ